MPRDSMVKYRKPGERSYAELLSLPAQSKMCYRCGKIMTGRHAGAHINVSRPQDYHHISEEGIAYTEAEMKELDLPGNVSHGFCPDCFSSESAKTDMQDKARAAARLATEEAKKQTDDARYPIPDPYRPIPEAYEPIAEAYEPVSPPIEPPGANVTEEQEG